MTATAEPWHQRFDPPFGKVPLPMSSAGIAGCVSITLNAPLEPVTKRRRPSGVKWTSLGVAKPENAPSVMNDDEVSGGVPPGMTLSSVSVEYESELTRSVS